MKLFSHTKGNLKRGLTLSNRRDTHTVKILERRSHSLPTLGTFFNHISNDIDSRDGQVPMILTESQLLIALLTLLTTYLILYLIHFYIFLKYAALNSYYSNHLLW